MTAKKSHADGVRERAADDAPRAHQESNRHGWIATIKHRWPTWLAIALAALTVGEALWRALRTSFPCWLSSIWLLPSCSDARLRG